jgi:nicotinamidase/pyrazinamidase
MAKVIKLAGIDFQNDFCAENGRFPSVTTGRLYVPGAYEAGQRAAKFIDNFGKNAIDMIFTIDQHPELHIAHTVAWQDSSGKHPDCYTEITIDDIEKRKWTPIAPSLFGKGPTGEPWELYYAKQLHKMGRYVLRMWNPHCKIGSIGGALIPPIEDALDRWCIKRRATVSFRPKGTNYRCEHYSGMQAEVEDPSDLISTGINKSLVEDFENCDEIYWTGIAGDFCLKNTMVDAFKLNPSTITKSVLITDAQASIYPDQFDLFVKEYTAKGLKTALTTDF